jgi:thiol-disulfide isomerase/thioredoxin
VNKSALGASIVLAGIVLGAFHYKLKPNPTEREFREYARDTSANTIWRDQIAPDFEIQTIQGESFRLSDVIGKKVIVLNFFATWCAPCRAEMPELNRYFDEHKNEDFLILAIDSEEQPERVTSFVKDLKLDFPTGIDEGPIQKQYRVESFPTTVLIGVDGKVQFYESGALANADVAFSEALQKNRDLIRSGQTIPREGYQQLAAKQTALPVHEEESKTSKDSDTTLDERGQRIVARMDCPCGCEKKVKLCVCHASSNIKTALAGKDYKDGTDDEIIKGLNKRFCSGAM